MFKHWLFMRLPCLAGRDRKINHIVIHSKTCRKSTLQVTWQIPILGGSQTNDLHINVYSINITCSRILLCEHLREYCKHGEECHLHCAAISKFVYNSLRGAIPAPSTHKPRQLASDHTRLISFPPCCHCTSCKLV